LDTKQKIRYQLIEQQVAKRLVAQNSLGLFDSLTSLRGLVLDNQYELNWLYNVGGQSVVFLARTLRDNEVVVKMALQAYHRPAYISTDNIRKGRARLEREANLLREFAGSLLPEFHDLIYSRNPLHSSARGDDIAEKEPYLVMEFIEGRTILDISREAHLTNPSDYRTIEWLSWESVTAVADFFTTVSTQSKQYLYSDVNPANLMIVNSQAQPIRILDAGSLVPLQPSPGLLAPFTSVFVRPDYYDAYRGGRPLWPTVSSIMYSVGKMLWAILTNRHPHPGIDPDLGNGHLKHYSSSLSKLVSDLVTMRFASFQKLRDAVEIARADAERPTSMDTLEIDSLSDKNVLGVESAYRINKKSSRSGQLREIAQATQAKGIGAIRYSPDGDYIAAATDRSIELLNSKNLKRLASFKSNHHKPIRCLDFDSSGAYLSSGSAGKVCIWDITRAIPIWQYSEEHLNGRIILGCDGKFVIAVTKWNALILTVKETQAGVKYYPGVAEPCACIAWAGLQLTLAVGGFGGTCVYHLPEEGEGDSSAKSKPNYVVQTREIVRFMALDDKATTLSMVTSDLREPTTYSLMVFRLPSIECITNVKLSLRSISTVMWERNGRFAFMGGSEGIFAVWDQKSGRECARLSECGPITSLDVGADCGTVAVSTSNGEVHIYEFE
jgi:serine/threonine protein kinase